MDTGVLARVRPREIPQKSTRTESGRQEIGRARGQCDDRLDTRATSVGVVACVSLSSTLHSSPSTARSWKESLLQALTEAWRTMGSLPIDIDTTPLFKEDGESGEPHSTASFCCCCCCRLRIDGGTYLDIAFRICEFCKQSTGSAYAR